MFISDFEKSDAYIKAFGKSVTLAEVRNVPINKRILKEVSRTSTSTLEENNMAKRSQ